MSTPSPSHLSKGQFSFKDIKWVAASLGHAYKGWRCHNLIFPIHPITQPSPNLGTHYPESYIHSDLNTFTPKFCHSILRFQNMYPSLISTPHGLFPIHSCLRTVPYKYQTIACIFLSSIIIHLPPSTCLCSRMKRAFAHNHKLKKTITLHICKSNNTYLYSFTKLLVHKYLLVQCSKRNTGQFKMNLWTSKIIFHSENETFVPASFTFKSEVF